MSQAPWTDTTIQGGSRVLESDPQRAATERENMLPPAFYLDQESRAAVLVALRRQSRYRGGNLLAAHVRTNHGHVVGEAEARPERSRNEFKAYASRELNRLGRDGPDRRRWARHGSTRWLGKDQDVRQAIEYGVEAQGESIALFVAEEA